MHFLSSRKPSREPSKRALRRCRLAPPSSTISFAHRSLCAHSDGPGSSVGRAGSVSVHTGIARAAQPRGADRRRRSLFARTRTRPAGVRLAEPARARGSVQGAPRKGSATEGPALQRCVSLHSLSSPILRFSPIASAFTRSRADLFVVRMAQPRSLRSSGRLRTATTPTSRITTSPDRLPPSPLPHPTSSPQGRTSATPKPTHTAPPSPSSTEPEPACRTSTSDKPSLHFVEPRRCSRASSSVMDGSSSSGA